ncbi:MAG: hydrogenase maturation protease [Pseudonocardiales bacterium]|nr:hydrogenase maturation protease [Pseudonocardiales bacterium]MBV9730490.1 hydrogenase maturation protease [Pseudonocardiales bacterium]
MTTMVAGIGNIFLGDDAFGVELARRLTAETLPDGVRVADYGIRGMHLAYDLLDMAPDTTILLDTVARGGEPGTIYVLEIQSGDVPGIEPSAVDAHGMAPDAVLALLDNLGGSAGRTLLVGCEPASTEEGIGLSTTVAAAVDRAVGVVLDLLIDKEGSEENVPSAASAAVLGVGDRPSQCSGTGV